MSTTARTLAAWYLERFSTPWRPLTLFPNPEDRGWCYLYGWNTQRYFETREPADSMPPGTGPIAVVKSTGAVWMLTSGTDFDTQLARYAAEHGIVI